MTPIVFTNNVTMGNVRVLLACSYPCNFDETYFRQVTYTQEKVYGFFFSVGIVRLTRVNHTLTQSNMALYPIEVTLNRYLSYIMISKNKSIAL